MNLYVTLGGTRNDALAIWILFGKLGKALRSRTRRAIAWVAEVAVGARASIAVAARHSAACRCGMCVKAVGTRTASTVATRLTRSWPLALRSSSRLHDATLCIVVRISAGRVQALLLEAARLGAARLAEGHRRAHMAQNALLIVARGAALTRIFTQNKCAGVAVAARVRLRRVTETA